MVLPVRFSHNSTGSNTLLELVGLWVGGFRSLAEQAHFYDYWLLKNGRRDLLHVARKMVADPRARHHLLSNETWGARVLSYVPGKKAEGVTVVTPVDQEIFHVAVRPASNFDSLESMPDPVSNGKGEIIFPKEPHHKISTDIGCPNVDQRSVRRFLRYLNFRKSQGFKITEARVKEEPGGYASYDFELAENVERPDMDPQLWEIAESWRLGKGLETGSIAFEALAKPADLVEEEPQVGERQAEEFLELHRDWRSSNVGSLFRKGDSESSFLAINPSEQACLVRNLPWSTPAAEITDDEGNKRLFSKPLGISYHLHHYSYHLHHYTSTHKMSSHSFVKNGFLMKDPVCLLIEYKPSSSEPISYQRDMVVGLAFLCKNLKSRGHYIVNDTADGKRYLQKWGGGGIHYLPQPGRGAEYNRAWDETILRILGETEHSPKMLEWRAWRDECWKHSTEVSKLNLLTFDEATTTEDTDCSSAVSETDVSLDQAD